MNLRYFKNIIPAAAIILASAGMTSCVGDLDVTPIDPSTNMTVDEPGLFTKCYANMALAGQTGPDGDCDIDGLDGKLKSAVPDMVVHVMHEDIFNSMHRI